MLETRTAPAYRRPQCMYSMHQSLVCVLGWGWGWGWGWERLRDGLQHSLATSHHSACEDCLKVVQKCGG